MRWWYQEINMRILWKVQPMKLIRRHEYQSRLLTMHQKQKYRHDFVDHFWTLNIIDAYFTSFSCYIFLGNLANLWKTSPMGDSMRNSVEEEESKLKSFPCEKSQFYLELLRSPPPRNKITGSLEVALFWKLSSEFSWWHATLEFFFFFGATT